MTKREIIQEVTECFREIDNAQLMGLALEIRGAKRVIVHGKGRMGLILTYLAALLSELGCRVHVVGSVTAPKIGRGDLMIVTPTGGDPKASTRFLEIARENGARIAAFTAYRAGRIGSMADCFIEARARTMNPEIEDIPSVQPMCSTLEQVGLLAFCAVAALLDPDRAFSPEEIKDVIADELSRCFYAADEGSLDRLGRFALKSPRIFFAGGKKELTLLSCYAMRVCHMGREVYIAGDPIAPEIRAGDALIVSCGGGRDPVLRALMESAAEAGAKIAVLTSCPEEFDELAAETCRLAGREDSFASRQRPGIAYGQGMLVALDYAVCRAMAENGWNEAELSSRHTNLE